MGRFNSNALQEDDYMDDFEGAPNRSNETPFFF